MYMLMMAGVVDLLLPSVHIPLFAWCLLILLWVCKGAVKEAKNQCLPEPVRKKKSSDREIYTPELDWIASVDYRGVYSTADGLWQLVKTSGAKDNADKYNLLSCDEETVVALSASKLASAMDQADFIINTLTPPRTGKK